jgi:hypothetical protein
MGTLFPYYHCTKGCKERQKAEIVNDAFVKLLTSLGANPGGIKLFAAVLTDKLKRNSNIDKTEVNKINLEIEKQKQRIQNEKSLMLDGEFSLPEFKEMKLEIEEKL